MFIFQYYIKWHVNCTIRIKTEDFMKKLIKKLEDIMVAVTFAEAGEYDEAIPHSGNSLQDNMRRSTQDLKGTALENVVK